MPTHDESCSHPIAITRPMTDCSTSRTLGCRSPHIAMSANALLWLRYQFNAAVFEAAFGCSVVSNRVGLAVASCSQATGIDTFGDQVVAYRIGAAGRGFLVLGVARGWVGHTAPLPLNIPPL